jgi:hypothetical protein
MGDFGNGFGIGAFGADRLVERTTKRRLREGSVIAPNGRDVGIARATVF